MTAASTSSVPPAEMSTPYACCTHAIAMSSVALHRQHARQRCQRPSVRFRRISSSRVQRDATTSVTNHAPTTSDDGRDCRAHPGGQRNKQPDDQQDGDLDDALRPIDRARAPRARRVAWFPRDESAAPRSTRVRRRTATVFISADADRRHLEHARVRHAGLRPPAGASASTPPNRRE